MQPLQTSKNLQFLKPQQTLQTSETPYNPQNLYEPAQSPK